MSKTNSWETDVIALLFNNTDAALIGDAAGLQNSAVAGSFYISLHTADPGEAGDQTTSETSYGSYARQAVARASGAGGWTCTVGQAQNVTVINFPQASSGTATITHFGIGTALSGVGKLLYKGTLTPNIAVSTGVTPQIPALGITVTED